MRLLQSKSLQLKEFIGDDHVPPYAILSHTWGDEEVLYHDLRDGDFQQKLGFKKIKYCCDQAIKDNLNWVWVDTCCVDKSSSAELSEAINSMFRWYQNSEVCYVYLADVSKEVDLHFRPSAFSNSRWFTRGWTLQELIAPSNVNFYSQCWSYLGNKTQLYDLLSEITGIEAGVLQGSDLESISVAKKMSWAAHRETTRSEDIAYCLLGLFNVNMPMLYGEGRKAFVRLQEEIIKSTSDHSIFAWGTATNMGTMDDFFSNPLYQWRKQSPNEQQSDQSEQSANSRPPILYRGLLANSPAEFAKSGNIIHLITWPGHDLAPITVTNGCVRIELPLISTDEGIISKIARKYDTLAATSFRNKSVCFAVLGCRTEDNYDYMLALPVKAWDTLHFGRIGVPVLIQRTHGYIDPGYNIRHSAQTLRIKPEKVIPFKQDKAFVIRELPNKKFGYKLVKVHCTPSGSYCSRTRTIIVGKNTNGPQAALVFCGSKPKFNFAVVFGRKLDLFSESSVPWAKPILLRIEDAAIEPDIGFEDNGLTEDQLIYSLQDGKFFKEISHYYHENDTCNLYDSLSVETRVERLLWTGDSNTFSDWITVKISKKES